MRSAQELDRLAKPHMEEQNFNETGDLRIDAGSEL
jgi:hypothetical protein